MVHNLFIDKASGAIRANLTGAAQPSISVAFNTVLQVRAKFILDGVTLALPDNTPVTMEVKRKGDYDGAAIALDLTAEVTGTDGDRTYLLKAAVTGDDLNTALAGKDSDEFILQFFWGEPVTDDAGASELLPLTITNTLVREGDALPSPLETAGWDYVKAKLPVVAGFLAHNEETKTITFTPGGVGEAGAKGDKGDKGDAGEAGAKGDKGDKGDTGEAGAKGDKGDKGDTGEAGAKGDKGDTGEAGAKGDKGDTGEAGAKGDKGDAGSGSSAIRVTGYIHGDTVADVPGTYATLDFDVNASGVDGDTFALTIDGVQQVFENDINGDGVADGNVAYTNDAAGKGTAINSIFSGRAVVSGNHIQITSATLGAGGNVAIDVTHVSSGDIYNIAPVNGINDVPASGAVIDVELVPAVTGKKVMMNYALLTDVMSLGCGAALVLRNGSTDTVIANATASGPFIPVNGNSNYYATGKDPGESLRLQASGTPSFEGAARAIVSVDQV